MHPLLPAMWHVLLLFPLLCTPCRQSSPRLPLLCTPLMACRWPELVDKKEWEREKGESEARLIVLKGC